MSTPPDTSPSRPRGPELRAALVHETLRQIEADGFAAFNLRGLTRALGVTQPAIYRHFASREELLTEAMVLGWTAFDEASLEIAGDDEPYGRLHRLGVGYVRYGAEHPGWFRLTFGRRGAVAAMMDRHDLRATGQELTLAALARVVPPDHPDFGPSYRAWWGLAHGLTFLTVEGVFSLVPDDEQRIAAAGEAIAAHLDGLRARWGPPGPPVALTFEELFMRLIPRG